MALGMGSQWREFGALGQSKGRLDMAATRNFQSFSLDQTLEPMGQSLY